MTREIKFRAWDKRKQEMSQGELSFRYENEHGIMNVYTDGVREIEEFELMQYTGLKDKNGKEIYEGDIIKWDTTGDGDENVVDEVKFKHGMFTYVEEPLCSHLTKEIEIIGNVYENSDLIK